MTIKETKDHVRVAVLLVPVWPDKKETPSPDLKPLADWSGDRK